MTRAIVFLGGCMLLLSQFQVTDGLYGGIDTSNYFALLLGAMVAIVCLVKVPKVLYRGDAMVFVLFVYLLIHASLTHAMQSREFYLSLSYFALYAVFRVIRAMLLANYVSFAVMFGGIYQSCLVLGQLLGYGISNHLRFVVTGSFFNPGPCGIFLAGVFVLAVAMMKKGYRKVGFNLMFVRYVTACVTFGVTLVAMIPTMSRAGWIGALVGVMLLYRGEIVSWGNTRRRWVIGGGIVGMIIVLTLFYLLKKDSANGRLFIWQNTVSAYWKTPLFGVGIDGFERAFAEAQHDYFEKEKVLEQAPADPVPAVGEEAVRHGRRAQIEADRGEHTFWYDAINDLMNKDVPALYDAALAEHGFHPVDEPSYDLVSVKKDEGFVATATTALQPELKLAQTTGFQSECVTPAVTDKEIDAVLERRRAAAAELVPHKGPAVKGNIVHIDYEGLLDGKAFAGGTAQNQTLQLGSGRMIPGFEDAFL